MIIGLHFGNFGRGESLDFEAIVLYMLFAFTLSFILLVANMFLVTIRYRVFEKSEYESTLSNYQKRMWIKKV